MDMAGGRTAVPALPFQREVIFIFYGVRSCVEHEIFMLKLTNQNECLLRFLVKNKSDMDYFLREFWTGSTNQFFAIQDFRLYKQNQHKMSLENFISSFNSDGRIAVETLLQHPVSISDFNILIEKLNNNQLTLESLYNSNKAYPSRNLPRILSSASTR